MEDHIQLKLGDRSFITRKDTLVQESEFFRLLFSNEHDSMNPYGVYFIDADSDLFGDILRYLRRGIFPLYWNKSKGHDYVRYLALCEEAKFFQIDRLSEWLIQEKYLRAVTVTTSVSVYAGLEEIENRLNQVVDAPDTVTEYVKTTENQKVYICPRGIVVHRGDPSRCGRQCNNAQGDSYMYEDVKKLIICRLAKKICIDKSVCKETYTDTENLTSTTVIGQGTDSPLI